MINISLQELAKILTVSYQGNEGCIHGVSIDTRTLKKGNLFIAIKGDKYDGHDFIEQARLAGASAALVERPIATTLPCIIVPSTVTALGVLASFWRAKFSIPCVAITGSNGKTTTKGMIASILNKVYLGDSSCYFVGEGNLNNHLGLPLNLLRVNASCKVMVFELGMSAFGEIAYLTRILRPTVAVITNALPSHLKGVGEGRLQDIAKAKGEILEELDENASCVLNRDSEFYDYWCSLSRGRKVYSFSSRNPSADVYAKSIELGRESVSFELITKEAKERVTLNVPGMINVANALAAAAACLALGISSDVIARGLSVFRGVYRRLQKHVLSSGAVLIDDSYNANPASMRAAIDVLIRYSEQKILVLGDMRELGRQEKKLHAEIGAYAKEAGIDYLFAVGDLIRFAVEAFGENAFHFENQEELIAVLYQRLAKDVVLLVKGSLSTRMDLVSKKLMNNGE